ncbi:MAG: hypothetical protein OEM59_19555, partial [Rhodospirillales bacterium]|nr:hypothetical protein [Rhodospirillales bacterium]
MRTFPIFIWLVALLAAAFTALILIGRDENHETEVARVAAFVEREIIAAAENDESLTVLPPVKV